MGGEATAPAANALPAPRRYFTLDEAERSLVFVRKVVGDIVEHYGELMRVRAEIESLSEALGDEHQIAKLRVRMEHLSATLNRLHDELNEVGCQLKDWQLGLVDFPAIHHGREVLICWAFEESSIRFWHEPDAGFAGRQPIGADF